MNPSQISAKTIHITKLMTTDNVTPQSPAPTKILLVDDHPVVRESLALRISREPDLRICATAGTGADALREIEHMCPDLAIVDLTLPDCHGLELVKDIHARFPAVRILVFSMHDENLFGERVLKAGAQGFLMKHESPDKVVAAIRTILSGRMAVSDSLSQRMLSNMGHSKNSNLPSIERLSDREIEVFQLLGQGHSTKEVSIHLGRSLKTIETYRQRIKEKLGITNGSELVAKAAAWVAAPRG